MLPCVVTVHIRAAGSSTPPVKTEHHIDFLRQEHRETWYMDHWPPAIQDRFIIELNRNDILSITCHTLTGMGAVTNTPSQRVPYELSFLSPHTNAQEKRRRSEIGNPEATPVNPPSGGPTHGTIRYGYTHITILRECYVALLVYSYKDAEPRKSPRIKLRTAVQRGSVRCRWKIRTSLETSLPTLKETPNEIGK